MQKTLLFAVVFISMINFHLNAFVINVPEDQPTIQDGINSSTNGDTILVASNVYYENINFNGKNIVVASHFILDSDYDYIHSTTIDGSNYSNQDTTSTVLIISGEDSNAVLQGFTIRGGEGSKWIDPDLPQYTWRGGGGILIFMASPIIKNNIIVDNAVTNTAGVDGAQGGGLLCYGGNPQIINNVIMGNEANYGAGMVVDYSGAIIKNNVIYGNFGGETYGGGGFWSIGNGDSQIIIENNTIVENSVTGGGTYGGRGGAMFVWNSTITARNNIMWGNTQSQGDPIALIGSSSAEITYCNIEGGYEGEGNIDQNPDFDEINFLLTVSSPCIDTGNADVAFNDPEDTNNPGQAKWPAMGGLRNDMGAYGGPGSMLLANDFTTGINPEYGLTPKGFYLDQNYPNPFNSSTTIEYTLVETSHVSLDIYNIMGQKIETLVDEKQNSGYKRINWDASDYSSGIYFYKLAVADRTLSRRMVLLK